MLVHTYWWGAELFPESDEEWHTMVGLFTGVTDLGGYDHAIGETFVHIDDGTGPDEKLYGKGQSYERVVDTRPKAVQDGKTTERRCISIDR